MLYKGFEFSGLEKHTVLLNKKKKKKSNILNLVFSNVKWASWVQQRAIAAVLKSLLICIHGHERTVVVTLQSEKRTSTRKVVRIKITSGSLMRSSNLLHTGYCHALFFMENGQIPKAASQSTLYVVKPLFSSCLMVNVILFLFFSSLFPLFNLALLWIIHKKRKNWLKSYNIWDKSLQVVSTLCDLCFSPYNIKYNYLLWTFSPVAIRIFFIVSVSRPCK